MLFFCHFLCDDISTEKVYSLVKACTLLIVHMYTLGDRSCASMAKSFILIGKPCTLAATRFTNSLMTDDNLTRRIKSYWNLFILYEKKFAQKWPCILTFCFIPTGPKLKVRFNFYRFQKQFFSHRIIELFQHIYHTLTLSLLDSAEELMHSIRRSPSCHFEWHKLSHGRLPNDSKGCFVLKTMPLK